MVTTKITSASACCDAGTRSPGLTARLLEQFRIRGSFAESVRWLKENDTQLHRAVMMVTAHHAGNEGACARTWRVVLGNLHNFAEQRGSWRLLDRRKSADFLGEVRAGLRKKEESCR